MGWLLIIWSLTAAGGVEVERTRWPTLEACLAHRESVAWRQPGRAEGTGTLVGACRPAFPADRMRVAR